MYDEVDLDLARVSTHAEDALRGHEDRRSALAAIRALADAALTALTSGEAA